MQAGAHWIDLADGRDYVAGFPAALDQEARAAGVLAVTGASSTPALSHAAAEVLAAGWRRLDTILAAISPGARAPRGLSVLRAILSYAGRPVRVWQGGAWRTVPGWSGARRIAMPGLGRRWASVCETPDLDLLPGRFPAREDALFLAGLELPVMHLGLALLAWPVRLGLMRSLVPLARPLRAAAGLLAWMGTDRGGMVVEATGVDADGEPVRARWALWAMRGAGPSTPAAPAVALVRTLVDGRAFEPGAVTAAGLLPLDAILRELDGLPVHTRRDEGWPRYPALFRRLLGGRFDALPTPVREVHAGEATASFEGSAVARSGPGLVARLLRAVLGLPRSGHHAARVTIVPEADGEAWTRAFGWTRFTSRLLSTPNFGVFEERFGPLHFAFRLDLTASGMTWRLVGWSLAGLPLPGALAPRIRAASEAAGKRYRFRVVVAHPWTGLLFAYRGTLDPQAFPTQLGKVSPAG